MWSRLYWVSWPGIDYLLCSKSSSSIQEAFSLFKRDVLASFQVREGAMSDLQTQLREVLRENELLRREVRNLLIQKCPVQFVYRKEGKKQQKVFNVTTALFFFQRTLMIAFSWRPKSPSWAPPWTPLRRSGALSWRRRGRWGRTRRPRCPCGRSSTGWSRMKLRSAAFPSWAHPGWFQSHDLCHEQVSGC